MVNYQNGKIYKIINSNDETIYIGSTAQYYLSKRWARHEYKNINNKIILIEKYPCNSCEELRKREQEIIEEHKDLINKKKAYQSIEDFKYKKKIRDEKYNEKLKSDEERFLKNKNNKINWCKKKVKCEFCNVEIEQNNLKKHQKRKICLKFR